MRPRLLLIVVPAFAAAAVAAAQTPPKAGTVTNPPVSGSAMDPSAPAPEAEAPPRATKPEGPQVDGAVRQQAESERRQALEQCQTLTGASRTDCVKRADDRFKRATSDDTLSGRGSEPPG